jgi:eukaryotic-like serine/threonine-protein kinase
MGSEITLQSSTGRRQSTVTAVSPDSLLNATIAGRYCIEAKIGAGGMGSVYRATRLMIGDAVAIKILHLEQGDLRAPERFRREAQAAARLKHGNAVVIHDFGITDEGLQYLVMELVEGKSLRQIIQEEGPISPSASSQIINQVCSALDEAHRHNIVHRDIKPDNIIVDVTATRFKVKVLDFGIAKLRDDTAGNLTQTGSILGTPHYMSPEQCLGEELDSRSDIYSLGIVLYEMLTGMVPFNSPTSAAVVVQHVTQPPAPLRSLNISIPPAVDAAVLHALEKQRDARPQTAAEFAANVSAAIVEGTRAMSSNVSNTAPSQLSQTGPHAQPTVVLAKPSTTNPSSLSSPTTTQSPKRSVLGYVGVSLGALILGGIIIWFVKADSNSNAGNSNAQPASTITPPNITATASSVLTSETVTDLINRWVRAQNEKDFGSYQSCYGVSFEGIKRTKSGRGSSYGFDGWMKDRWKMLRVASGFNLEIKNLRISIEGDSALVEFDQYYRSLRYSDWGPKVIRIKLTPAGEKIVYEELKASHLL